MSFQFKSYNTDTTRSTNTNLHFLFQNSTIHMNKCSLSLLKLQKYQLSHRVSEYICICTLLPLMSWCCEQVFSFTQCLFCGLNYNDEFTFMFTSHLHSPGMSSLKLTIWKSPRVCLTSALFMLSQLFSGCGDILRGFKLNKQWRLWVCSTARNTENP